MSIAPKGVAAKKCLFTAIGSIAARFGFHVSRRTPEIEMGKFLQKLRATSSQADLIRVGGPVDGGYWIPDDLEGIQAVFSPGVGNLSEFELSSQSAISLASWSMRRFKAQHEATRIFTFNPCG